MDLYQKLLAEQRNAEEQGLGNPIPSKGELEALQQYTKRGVSCRGEAISRAKLMTKYPLAHARILGDQEEQGKTL